MSSVKLWTITCASLMAAAFAVGASAAELRIFSTIGMQSALEVLTPKFEATTGNRLQFTWGTAAVLVKRVQDGQAADLLILTRQGLDALARAGKVVVGPQADLASSGIAVVVKKGAPKPDISTPLAFKQTLLRAKSIAFSDPAAGGASGVYIAKLLQRMGIAAQMKSKIRYPPPSGNAAVLVANGEAELAVQEEPEVISAPGVELVGVLPVELNHVTLFSAGIAAGSREAKAAAELMRFLHTPEAVAVFRDSGLTPVAASN